MRVRQATSRLLAAWLLALAAVAPAAAPARADTRLVLPGSALPGLHAVRASPRVATSDLASGLPAALARAAARAQTETAAGAGAGQHVRSDAFVFGSSRVARQVLIAWKRAHRAAGVAIGDGGVRAAHGRSAIVAWRSGARVGVLVLTVSSRLGDPRPRALRDAVLADSWLRSPLPSTAWDRVLTQIRPNGTVSQATALEAFTAAYGPLPGVPRPSGRRTAIPSGTLAAQWILSYRSRLTRAQRNVVQRVLGISLASGRAARIADFDDPGFHQQVEIQGMADDAVVAYQKLLGHTLGMKVVAGVTTTVVKTEKGQYPYADTISMDAQGGYGPGPPAICRIRLTPVGNQQSVEFINLVIDHEVFHCFQGDIIGTRVWGTGLPAWIGEGTADWAALSIDPVSYKVGGGNLTAYIGSPHTPLFERSYDAVGFWGHVDDTFPSLWSRMTAILTVGTDQGSYVLAHGGDDGFLTNWGSSLFRATPTEGGPAWQMHSPLAPPGYAQMAPGGIEVINPSILGGNGSVDAPPYTTSQYIVQPSADEPVLHVGIRGHARLSEKHDYTGLEDGWFCTNPGGCTCPPGTIGEVPPTQPLESISILGLSGDPDGGTYGDLTSYPLSTFCQRKPSPTHGGNGISNGDPYLTTFDGSWYVFQTAGEFTLVKSRTDGLEVQARQQPYPLSTYPEFAGSLAMNTAFAMRDGNAIVEVDRGTPLVLYVNRHRRRLHAGQTIALSGGARVRYGRTQVVIAWSDGTVARVLSIGSEGVNLAMRPTPDRAGLLTGLLGNDNGNDADDFVGRGGHRYSPNVFHRIAFFGGPRSAERVVYGQFGKSWLITQRASLFVYPPGKTTRSYLVPGFPRHSVGLFTLPSARRQAGAVVCRHAHVDNAALLNGCMIDVGATGNRTLASATGTLQHAAGIPGSGTGTPAGIVRSTVPWTMLSSQNIRTVALLPAIATAGTQVVAAYSDPTQTGIEVASFTPGSSGVTGLSRTAFTGWLTISDPVLLPRPGGLPGLILSGQHSGDSNDPLNGTVIEPRNPDGSFGPASSLSSTMLCCVTSAALAANGSTPLWADGQYYSLLVFSGTIEHDLTASSPGTPHTPTLARDASGRLWMAWYVFSEQPTVSGLYMMQLDPQTGLSIGPAMHVPESDAGPDIARSISLACAQTCRVLYANTGVVPEQILSWAPGEAAPTTVLSGLIENREQALDLVSAAYTPDGRLWVAWTNESPPTEYAKLGDARGAGGTLVQLPAPAGFSDPQNTVAVTAADRLALVSAWTDGRGANAVWGTVVNPP